MGFSLINLRVFIQGPIIRFPVISIGGMRRNPQGVDRQPCATLGNHDLRSLGFCMDPGDLVVVFLWCFHGPEFP